MKKLVIAVIVLSFFGLGPLKSLLQSGTENDGEGKNSISILEKLKDSSKSEAKVETFLIMEKSTDPASSNSELGMLLKYDKVNNKIKYGTILVPMIEQIDDMDELKSSVKEAYQMDIDYCFILDTSRIGTVIDLIAPNGIDIKKDYNGQLDGVNQTLKGEDFVLPLEQLKIDPSYTNDLSPIFMALKQEIMKEISADTMLTLAPQVINETLKSVTTDMGKGKLMDLGLSVMMNPVTSVEQIDVMASNQKGVLEKVNKMFEVKQEQY